MKMHESSLEKLQLMERAALKAAEYLRDVHSSGAKVEATRKSDNTMVMNLDVECQKIILKLLAPVLPVAAEEDEASHRLISGSDDYFTVDPIDGTASCKRYLGIEGGQIGFGPLIGLVSKGKLAASVYFNLPTSTLFSAIAGEGSYSWKQSASAAAAPPLSTRKRLAVSNDRPINESGMLFFPGGLPELKVVLYFRSNDLVENTYRLGGFASDCTRLAEGREQIQLQTPIKAWDFAAALIPVEAGLYAELDPFGKGVPFHDWTVARLNPILITLPSHHSFVKANILKAVSGN